MLQKIFFLKNKRETKEKISVRQNKKPPLQSGYFYFDSL